METDDLIPRIRRDLEIIPVSFQGAEAHVLRDGLGLIEEPVVIQGEGLAILGLLDGKHSVSDIQTAIIRRQGGILVRRETVEAFIADLERHNVLDSPRFREALKTFLSDYAREPVRTACLAGRSYPADALALGRYLEAILESDGGDAGPSTGDGVCALAAPHIEIEAGRRLYARAYRSLRGAAPSRVVLFGTGHSLADGYFSLTGKDFETPLGLVHTDKAAVAELRWAGAEAVSPSDIAHRREHSLEFQLVFLQHLFGSGFSLVPVLCGSFQAHLGDVSRPFEIPGAAGFLGALKDLVAGWGEKTLCVAGVDFSHIGPKFGHREQASELRLEAGRHDRALIAAACRGDVRGFWRESQRVKDRYNVCGFSSLASLLEVIGPSIGELL
jgi:AmmeMemoRadiSam system protein B